MGFLGFGGGNGGGKRSNPLYILTPVGSDKFDKMDDNPKDSPGGLWHVMDAIREDGPSDIASIANHSGMQEDRVKRTIEANPALFVAANSGNGE